VPFTLPPRSHCPVVIDAGTLRLGKRTATRVSLTTRLRARRVEVAA
jgi:hypothetical protein